MPQSLNAQHQLAGHGLSLHLACMCGVPAQKQASNAASECRPGSQCQWLISPLYSPIALSILSLELATSDSLAIYDGPAANSSRLRANLTGVAQAAAHSGVICSPAQPPWAVLPQSAARSLLPWASSFVLCLSAAGRVNPALLCSQLHVASIRVLHRKRLQASEFPRFICLLCVLLPPADQSARCPHLTACTHPTCPQLKEDAPLWSGVQAVRLQLPSSRAPLLLAVPGRLETTPSCQPWWSSPAWTTAQQAGVS